MNKKLEKGYVYLLVSQDLKSFKIGKANEVNTRVDQLSKHWNFNLNESYIIETDFNNTFNLERLLHRFLANYKINIFAKKDGYTEFFDINGLSFVLEFKELLSKTNNTRIISYQDFIKVNSEKPIIKNTNNIIQFSRVSSLFELDIFFTICDKYLRSLEQEVVIKMTDIACENTLKLKKQRNFNEERITQNLISFLLNPIVEYDKPLINKDYRRKGKSFIFTINKDFFNKELFSFILKINHKKMFNLRSIYSKQMYILIKQLEKETTFSKEFLEDYFYLPPSLKEYASFKQRVLTYTSKELKDIMKIEIKYKEIKTIRAVSKISLSSKYKQKNKENILQAPDKICEPKIPVNNQFYNINYTNQTLINTSF